MGKSYLEGWGAGSLNQSPGCTLQRGRRTQCSGPTMKTSCPCRQPRGLRGEHLGRPSPGGRAAPQTTAPGVPRKPAGPADALDLEEKRKRGQPLREWADEGAGTPRPRGWTALLRPCPPLLPTPAAPNGGQLFFEHLLFRKTWRTFQNNDT